MDRGIELGVSLNPCQTLSSQATGPGEEPLANLALGKEPYLYPVEDLLCSVLPDTHVSCMSLSIRRALALLSEKPEEEPRKSYSLFWLNF